MKLTPVEINYLKLDSIKQFSVAAHVQQAIYFILFKKSKFGTFYENM